jgi:hypothetical protein
VQKVIGEAIFLPLCVSAKGQYSELFRYNIVNSRLYVSCTLLAENASFHITLSYIHNTCFNDYMHSKIIGFYPFLLRK